MFRMHAAALLALTGSLALALPAAAQEQVAPDEIVVSREGPQARQLVVDEVLIADQRRAPVGPGLDDEIVVACLRLPTLADLSKERWNEVHRRFDGRRGRPLRNA